MQAKDHYMQLNTEEHFGIQWNKEKALPRQGMWMVVP
jgi:hypothetical protein